MSTEVLSPEQNKIANLPKNGIVIVKGIAGSGKTTVGIHRLKYIVNNIALEGDSIAYLTFNKTLISYIDQLIGAEDFNISDNGQATIEFATKKNSSQHVGTVSKLMMDYFFEYIKENNLYIKSLDNESEKLFYLRKGMNEIEEEFNNKNISIFKAENHKFLLEEIDWIRSCRIETEKEYQVIERKGRIRSGTENSRRLPIKSDIRQHIFKLSRKYNKLLWNDHKADFILKETYALEQIKNNPNGSFEHIIVDECQDLSKMQFAFLKHLIKERDNATATLLYDTSQSIYPNSWLAPNRPLSSLGIKSNYGNTRTLKKNWRTTAEIQKAAISLIENIPEIRVEKNIEFINRSNTLPVHYKAKDPNDHNNYIIELIKSKTNTFNKKNIAITSRTRAALNQLKKLLDANNIENEIVDSQTTDFNRDKVRLFTMHSIKGLESDIVIMAHLNDGHIPFRGSFESELGLIQERKLMYVAMTRARHQLYMVSSTSKPTRFLKDIDPKFIKKYESDTFDFNEPSERHPNLKKEYELFEILLNDIGKFKEDANKDLDVKERKKRYHQLFKELLFAEEKLNKILNTLDIASFDKEELSSIKEQVIQNLEYDNFSKYGKDNLHDNSDYKILKKNIQQKIKNECRQLNPEERNWVAEILIKFEDVESIIRPRYIFIDMFKIMEVSIRKKFGFNSDEFKSYSIGKIVGVNLNVNNWRNIREKIVSSNVIEVRNKLSHDIGDISIDELIKFKKLLFDEGLLKTILKTKI